MANKINIETYNEQIVDEQGQDVKQAQDKLNDYLADEVNPIEAAKIAQDTEDDEKFERDRAKKEATLADIAGNVHNNSLSKTDSAKKNLASLEEQIKRYGAESNKLRKEAEMEEENKSPVWKMFDAMSRPLYALEGLFQGIFAYRDPEFDAANKVGSDDFIPLVSPILNVVLGSDADTLWGKVQGVGESLDNALERGKEGFMAGLTGEELEDGTRMIKDVGMVSTLLTGSTDVSSWSPMEKLVGSIVPMVTLGAIDPVFQGISLLGKNKVAISRNLFKSKQFKQTLKNADEASEVMIRDIFDKMSDSYVERTGLEFNMSDEILSTARELGFQPMDLFDPSFEGDFDLNLRVMEKIQTKIVQKQSARAKDLARQSASEIASLNGEFAELIGYFADNKNIDALRELGGLEVLKKNVEDLDRDYFNGKGVIDIFDENSDTYNKDKIIDVFYDKWGSRHGTPTKQQQVFRDAVYNNAITKFRTVVEQEGRITTPELIKGLIKSPDKAIHILQSSNVMDEMIPFLVEQGVVKADIFMGAYLESLLADRTTLSNLAEKVTEKQRQMREDALKLKSNLAEEKNFRISQIDAEDSADLIEDDLLTLTDEAKNVKALEDATTNKYFDSLIVSKAIQKAKESGVDFNSSEFSPVVDILKENKSTRDINKITETLLPFIKETIDEHITDTNIIRDSLKNEIKFTEFIGGKDVEEVSANFSKINDAHSVIKDLGLHYVSDSTSMEFREAKQWVDVLNNDAVAKITGEKAHSVGYKNLLTAVAKSNELTKEKAAELLLDQYRIAESKLKGKLFNIPDGKSTEEIFSKSISKSPLHLKTRVEIEELATELAEAHLFNKNRDKQMSNATKWVEKLKLYESNTPISRNKDGSLKFWFDIPSSINITEGMEKLDPKKVREYKERLEDKIINLKQAAEYKGKTIDGTQFDQMLKGVAASINGDVDMPKQMIIQYIKDTNKFPASFWKGAKLTEDYVEFLPGLDGINSAIEFMKFAENHVTDSYLLNKLSSEKILQYINKDEFVNRAVKRTLDDVSEDINPEDLELITTNATSKAEEQYWEEIKSSNIGNVINKFFKTTNDQGRINNLSLFFDDIPFDIETEATGISKVIFESFRRSQMKHMGTEFNSYGVIEELLIDAHNIEKVKRTGLKDIKIESQLGYLEQKGFEIKTLKTDKEEILDNLTYEIKSIADEIDYTTSNIKKSEEKIGRLTEEYKTSKVNTGAALSEAQRGKLATYLQNDEVLSSQIMAAERSLLTSNPTPVPAADVLNAISGEAWAKDITEEAIQDYFSTDRTDKLIGLELSTERTKLNKEKASLNRLQNRLLSLTKHKDLVTNSPEAGNVLQDSSDIISRNRTIATNKSTNTFDNIIQNKTELTGAEGYDAKGGTRVTQDPAVINRLRSEGFIHNDYSYLLNIDKDRVKPLIPVFEMYKNNYNGADILTTNLDSTLLTLSEKYQGEALVSEMKKVKDKRLKDIMNTDYMISGIVDNLEEIKAYNYKNTLDNVSLFWEDYVLTCPKLVKEFPEEATRVAEATSVYGDELNVVKQLLIDAYSNSETFTHGANFEAEILNDVSRIKEAVASGNASDLTKMTDLNADQRLSNMNYAENPEYIPGEHDRVPLPINKSLDELTPLDTYSVITERVKQLQQSADTHKLMGTGHSAVINTLLDTEEIINVAMAGGRESEEAKAYFDAIDESIRILKSTNDPRYEDASAGVATRLLNSKMTTKDASAALNIGLNKISKEYTSLLDVFELESNSLRKVAQDMSRSEESIPLTSGETLKMSEVNLSNLTDTELDEMFIKQRGNRPVPLLKEQVNRVLKGGTVKSKLNGKVVDINKDNLLQKLYSDLEQAGVSLTSKMKAKDLTLLDVPSETNVNTKQLNNILTQDNNFPKTIEEAQAQSTQVKRAQRELNSWKNKAVVDGKPIEGKDLQEASEFVKLNKPVILSEELNNKIRVEGMKAKIAHLDTIINTQVNDGLYVNQESVDAIKRFRTSNNETILTDFSDKADKLVNTDAIISKDLNRMDEAQRAINNTVLSMKVRAVEHNINFINSVAEVTGNKSIKIDPQLIDVILNPNRIEDEVISADKIKLHNKKVSLKNDPNAAVDDVVFNPMTKQTVIEDLISEIQDAGQTESEAVHVLISDLHSLTDRVIRGIKDKDTNLARLQDFKTLRLIEEKGQVFGAEGFDADVLKAIDKDSNLPFSVVGETLLNESKDIVNKSKRLLNISDEVTHFKSSLQYLRDAEDSELYKLISDEAIDEASRLKLLSTIKDQMKDEIVNKTVFARPTRANVETSALYDTEAPDYTTSYFSVADAKNARTEEEYREISEASLSPVEWREVERVGFLHVGQKAAISKFERTLDEVIEVELFNLLSNKEDASPRNLTDSISEVIKEFATDESIGGIYTLQENSNPIVNQGIESWRPQDSNVRGRYRKIDISEDFHSNFERLRDEREFIEDIVTLVNNFNKDKRAYDVHMALDTAGRRANVQALGRIPKTPADYVNYASEGLLEKINNLAPDQTTDSINRFLSEWVDLLGDTSESNRHAEVREILSSGKLKYDPINSRLSVESVKGSDINIDTMKESLLVDQLVAREKLNKNIISNIGFKVAGDSAVRNHTSGQAGRIFYNWNIEYQQDRLMNLASTIASKDVDNLTKEELTFISEVNSVIERNKTDLPIIEKDAPAEQLDKIKESHLKTARRLLNKIGEDNIDHIVNNWPKGEEEFSKLIGDSKIALASNSSDWNKKYLKDHWATGIKNTQSNSWYTFIRKNEINKGKFDNLESPITLQRGKFPEVLQEIILSDESVNIDKLAAKLADKWTEADTLKRSRKVERLSEIATFSEMFEGATPGDTLEAVSKVAKTRAKVAAISTYGEYSVGMTNDHMFTSPEEIGATMIPSMFNIYMKELESNGFNEWAIKDIRKSDNNVVELRPGDPATNFMSAAKGVETPEYFIEDNGTNLKLTHSELRGSWQSSVLYDELTFYEKAKDDDITKFMDVSESQDVPYQVLEDYIYEGGDRYNINDSPEKLDTLTRDDEEFYEVVYDSFEEDEYQSTFESKVDTGNYDVDSTDVRSSKIEEAYLKFLDENQASDISAISNKAESEEGSIRLPISESDSVSWYSPSREIDLSLPAVVEIDGVMTIHPALVEHYRGGLGNIRRKSISNKALDLTSLNREAFKKDNKITNLWTPSVVDPTSPQQISDNKFVEITSKQVAADELYRLIGSENIMDMSIADVKQRIHMLNIKEAEYQKLTNTAGVEDVDYIPEAIVNRQRERAAAKIKAEKKAKLNSEYGGVFEAITKLVEEIRFEVNVGKAIDINPGKLSDSVNMLRDRLGTIQYQEGTSIAYEIVTELNNQLMGAVTDTIQSANKYNKLVRTLGDKFRTWDDLYGVNPSAATFQGAKEELLIERDRIEEELSSIEEKLRLANERRAQLDNDIANNIVAMRGLVVHEGEKARKTRMRALSEELADLTSRKEALKERKLAIDSGRYKDSVDNNYAALTNMVESEQEGIQVGRYVNPDVKAALRTVFKNKEFIASNSTSYIDNLNGLIKAKEKQVEKITEKIDDLSRKKVGGLITPDETKQITDLDTNRVLLNRQIDTLKGKIVEKAEPKLPQHVLKGRSEFKTLFDSIRRKSTIIEKLSPEDLAELNKISYEYRSPVVNKALIEDELHNELFKENLAKQLDKGEIKIPGSSRSVLNLLEDVEALVESGDKLLYNDLTETQLDTLREFYWLRNKVNNENSIELVGEALDGQIPLHGVKSYEDDRPIDRAYGVVAKYITDLSTEQKTNVYTDISQYISDPTAVREIRSLIDKPIPYSHAEINPADSTYQLFTVGKTDLTVEEWISSFVEYIERNPEAKDKFEVNSFVDTIIDTWTKDAIDGSLSHFDPVELSQEIPIRERKSILSEVLNTSTKQLLDKFEVPLKYSQNTKTNLNQQIKTTFEAFGALSKKVAKDVIADAKPVVAITEMSGMDQITEVLKLINLQSTEKVGDIETNEIVDAYKVLSENLGSTFPEINEKISTEVLVNRLSTILSMDADNPELFKLIMKGSDDFEKSLERDWDKITDAIDQGTELFDVEEAVRLGNIRDISEEATGRLDAILFDKLRDIKGDRDLVNTTLTEEIERVTKEIEGKVAGIRNLKTKQRNTGNIIGASEVNRQKAIYESLNRRVNLLNNQKRTLTEEIEIGEKLNRNLLRDKDTYSNKLDQIQEIINTQGNPNTTAEHSQLLNKALTNTDERSGLTSADIKSVTDFNQDKADVYNSIGERGHKLRELIYNEINNVSSTKRAEVIEKIINSSEWKDLTSDLNFTELLVNNIRTNRGNKAMSESGLINKLFNIKDFKSDIPSVVTDDISMFERGFVLSLINNPAGGSAAAALQAHLRSLMGMTKNNKFNPASILYSIPAVDRRLLEAIPHAFDLGLEGMQFQTEELRQFVEKATSILKDGPEKLLQKLYKDIGLSEEQMRDVLSRYRAVGEVLSTNNFTDNGLNLNAVRGDAAARESAITQSEIESGIYDNRTPAKARGRKADTNINYILKKKKANKALNKSRNQTIFGRKIDANKVLGMKDAGDLYDASNVNMQYFTNHIFHTQAKKVSNIINSSSFAQTIPLLLIEGGIMHENQIKNVSRKAYRKVNAKQLQAKLFEFTQADAVFQHLEGKQDVKLNSINSIKEEFNKLPDAERADVGTVGGSIASYMEDLFKANDDILKEESNVYIPYQIYNVIMGTSAKDIEGVMNSLSQYYSSMMQIWKLGTLTSIPFHFKNMTGNYSMALMNTPWMAPHINHNGSTLMGALGEAEDVVKKISKDISSGNLKTSGKFSEDKLDKLNFGEFMLSNGKVVDTTDYDMMKLAIIDELHTNKGNYKNMEAKIRGVNKRRSTLEPADVAHMLFKDLDNIRITGPRTMADIDKYGYSMNMLDRRSITSVMKDKILADEVLRINPEYADNLKIGKGENQFSEVLKSYMSASRDSTGRFRLGWWSMLKDDEISMLEAFTKFRKANKGKSYLSDKELDKLAELSHQFGFGDGKNLGTLKLAKKDSDILSRHEFEEIISNFTDKERKVWNDAKQRMWSREYNWSSPEQFVKDLTFDASDLNSKSDKAMQLVFPFWSFMKKSIDINLRKWANLDFRDLYRLNRVVNGIRESQMVALNEVSEWTRQEQYIPIQVEDGRIVELKWGNPTNTLSKFLLSDKPIINELASSSNPIIKFVISEAAGRQNLFTGDEYESMVGEAVDMIEPTAVRNLNKSLQTYIENGKIESGDTEVDPRDYKGTLATFMPGLFKEENAEKQMMYNIEAAADIYSEALAEKLGDNFAYDIAEIIPDAPQYTPYIWDIYTAVYNPYGTSELPSWEVTEDLDRNGIEVLDWDDPEWS